MNRDALLATLIGLALGLTITGLLILGPQIALAFPKLSWPAISLFKPKESSGSAVIPKPPTFTVVSPLPEAIETNNQLVVSGTALPRGVVVVSGLLDEDVVAVGADAKFAGKITLTEGKNDLTVTQYLNGKSTSVNLTVYFTPENF